MVHTLPRNLQRPELLLEMLNSNFFRSRKFNIFYYFGFKKFSRSPFFHQLRQAKIRKLQEKIRSQRENFLSLRDNSLIL